MSDTIKKDMVVGLEYVLRLENGQEIDRSGEDEPLEYLHGHGNIIPGLESELAGLKIGDSKEVKVSPAWGYGEYDPENVDDYPRDNFPASLKLEVGSMLEVRDPDGMVGLAVVRDIQDDTVKLDFNHPLAGETLHFSVRVISLREASAEELTHGHAHGAHGHH